MILHRRLSWSARSWYLMFCTSRSLYTFDWPYNFSGFFQQLGTCGLSNKMQKGISKNLIEQAAGNIVLSSNCSGWVPGSSRLFMIAIQLASILAMARSADLYGATNLNQLAENISVSGFVSIGAMVSITLGLWLVHTTNMNSWYTLFCSTITIFLSIATFHMSNHWPATPDCLSLPEDNGGL